MKAEGIIADYAVGDAIAAMFYIAPFSTEDLDVFFSVTTTETGLDLLGPIHRYIERAGYRAEGAAIHVEGWPVQFLPLYNPLVDEAVQQADERTVSGVPVRVMQAEHLVAIIFARCRTLCDSTWRSAPAPNLQPSTINVNSDRTLSPAPEELNVCCLPSLHQLYRGFNRNEVKV